MRASVHLKKNSSEVLSFSVLIWKSFPFFMKIRWRNVTHSTRHKNIVLILKPQVSTAQLKVVFHHYCKRKYQRNCFSKKCCYFFLNKDKQITRCLDFVKSVPLFKTSPFFPPKYRISLVFTISSEEDMYKSCFWSNLW